MQDISTLEKQFNRTSISINDFSQAEKYLEFLSKAELPQLDILRSSLLVAAIISYARPFSDNNAHEKATGKLKVSEKEIRQVIGKRGLELHKKVLGLRNRAIAHSEYDMNPTRLVEKHVGEHGFVLTSRFFNILGEEIDPNLFLKLSQKMGLLISARLFTLVDKIKPGESNLPEPKGKE
jgi:hypothetical protein